MARAGRSSPSGASAASSGRAVTACRDPVRDSWHKWHGASTRLGAAPPAGLPALPAGPRPSGTVPSNPVHHAISLHRFLPPWVRKRRFQAFEHQGTASSTSASGKFKARDETRGDGRGGETGRAVGSRTQRAGPNTFYLRGQPWTLETAVQCRLVTSELRGLHGPPEPVQASTAATWPLRVRGAGRAMASRDRMGQAYEPGDRRPPTW